MVRIKQEDEPYPASASELSSSSSSSSSSSGPTPVHQEAVLPLSNSKFTFEFRIIIRFTHHACPGDLFALSLVAQPSSVSVSTTFQTCECSFFSQGMFIELNLQNQGEECKKPVDIGHVCRICGIPKHYSCGPLGPSQIEHVCTKCS